MDEDVPKAGQRFESLDEIRLEPVVTRQVSDSLRVIFEPVTATSRKLTRDVDHELAQRQLREQHVVVEAEIPLESCAIGDPRTELPQVIKMQSKLGEAFDEVSHRGANASSLIFCMRSRNGCKSAARS